MQCRIGSSANMTRKRHASAGITIVGALFSNGAAAGPSGEVAVPAGEAVGAIRVQTLSLGAKLLA